VLSDAKDVVQTVFVRIIFNFDQAEEGRMGATASGGDIEEVLHFDLAVHQCVRHALFDFGKLPYLLVQSYTQVMALNVATMSLSKLFRLELEGDECKMGFP
jgi:hypothetical protein